MTVRVQRHVVSQILAIRYEYLAASAAVRARGAVDVDNLPNWLVDPLALEHRK